MADKAQKLEKKRKAARLGGGQEKIDKHHKTGRLTARERVEVLLDPDSFYEFDSLVEHRCVNWGMDEKIIPGDGVIIGYGTINGRVIFVCSQDFTVYGGSLGEMHAKKIIKLQNLAIQSKSAIIFINDSGGARIQEGVDALGGYGDIFQNNVEASGVIPQISVIMGPCAGGAVYLPALTDFTFMVRNTSYMYLTGPDVVRAVLHEEISHEKLGGAEVHGSKSGVVDFVFDNDIDCLQQVRRLIDFLPLNSETKPPSRSTSDPYDRVEMYLTSLVPADPVKPYDMDNLISKIVDEEDFMEVKADFARNIITGFCRFAGMPVGVIANQPKHLAGCLDIDASCKAARFIRTCDNYNIPIVTIVDVPGFLPGKQQEYGGIIRHGAKLIYAYAEATVPKITLIVRKAYGGAYIVMGSKHLSSDINYAWPNAEVAVMGADGAIAILSKNKDLTQEEVAHQVKEYKNQYACITTAAARGFVDEIIRPYNTRLHICKALALLEKKGTIKKGRHKKHCNIPL